MLRGLRKSSTGWFGKTVMVAVVGFLTLSFAVWGIGDIFRGFGRSTFAKIGGTEVGIEQFRQIYNDRLQSLSRQLRVPLTMEQARQRGYDRAIVGEFVAQIALDERARALRLGVSDADISRRITENPVFKGPNGQFDRSRFIELLRQIGQTEARFIAEQRREIVRKQIEDTIKGPTILPNAAVEAAERFQNEQRTIEYVLLDRAKAGEVAPPQPEVLAKYFEDRKVLFRAPEYRKLVIVTLIPGEQAKGIEISDAELRKAYEERRGRFMTPERRQIHQLLFDSVEDATAAAERIAAKGATFTEIAAERGKSEKDIDLGLVTEGAVIDRAVADAAFALKQDEVSKPVAGSFGTWLLMVVKIEPEHIRPFEEVSDELKSALALERAKSDLLAVYDKIEDERSLGKTLAESAEKLKLPIRRVDVDRSGRDRDGNPVQDLPEPQRLLAGSFAAEMGIEIDPLKVDDGYIWYEVTEITQARDRTLDELRDRVETRWRDDEVATRLHTKAGELLDKLKAGTPLAELAMAEGLTVETKAEIRRRSTGAPLSARALDAVFRTPKDTASFAPAATGSEQPAEAGEQMVFRVTDIKIPTIDLNSGEAKNIRDVLGRMAADDLFAEYVARVENEVGVTINEPALRQIVTGARGDVDDNN
jgi:peptidyl-prolyl cis-trans isomerase D